MIMDNSNNVMIDALQIIRALILMDLHCAKCMGSYGNLWCISHGVAMQSAFMAHLTGRWSPAWPVKPARPVWSTRHIES